MLFPGFLLALLLVGEVQYTHVAELHTCTMTEEADVAGLVEHARMVAVVHGVGILVAAVGSHIVSLASFTYITVHNHFSVDRHGDMVTLYTYLLGAPFAQRLVLDTLGRDDTIYRAVNLILVQSGVDGVVVIQDL